MFLFLIGYSYYYCKSWRSYWYPTWSDIRKQNCIWQFAYSWTL